MPKIKTHLVFPTALHIFNHSMEQEEKQLMLDYIKGTRNKETVLLLDYQNIQRIIFIRYQSLQN